jgi:hypothetical protein
VDRWLSDARSTNNFRDESGIAYTIPSGQRKRLATGESSMHNYAIPIDDQEVLALIDERDDQEERAIRQDTINMVRTLAKRVDPSGIGRMSLGITEILSPSEIELLGRASFEQLGFPAQQRPSTE